MQGLVSALHQVPTPLALVSRRDVIDDIKSAHAALIRSAFGQGAADSLDDAELSNLRRYALWLEDVALGSETQQDEVQSLLRVASETFEFVGRTRLADGAQQTREIFVPPLSDLLHAALLGSMTAYPSRQDRSARRIIDLVPEVAGDASTIEKPHLTAVETVANLLARDYRAAILLGRRLQEEQRLAVEDLERGGAPPAGWYALDSAVAIGNASASAAMGMLVGETHLLDQARETLEKVSAPEAGRAPMDRWLSSTLARVVREMHARSMHRLLGAARAPLPFRRSLARDGVLELWGPQLQAVEAGILESTGPRGFVVTIPTGAGKTLIAELAVLGALGASDSHWAVYVAPTRALVAQVSQSLRTRLSDAGIRVQTFLAGAEQTADAVDELGILQTANTVTVTTPEKLDAYYRNARSSSPTALL